MAKKKVANGGIANASGSSTSTSPIPPKATATPEPSAYSRVDIMSASASLTAAGRDPIKVNNVNAADLKNACDDAVKKVRYVSMRQDCITLSFSLPESNNSLVSCLGLDPGPNQHRSNIPFFVSSYYPNQAYSKKNTPTQTSNYYLGGQAYL